MIHRRAEKEVFSDDRDLKRVVKADTVIEILAFDSPAFGSGPCATKGTWGGTYPTLLERQTQLLVGRSCSREVVQIRRPVGRIGR